MFNRARSIGVFLFSMAVVFTADSAVAATVEVAAMPNNTFVPADVTIAIGDSVHWSGLAGGLHTVEEVDDPSDLVYNGSGFQSAAFANEFTFTFNSPGLFHYICQPHVALFNMRGTVTVEGVSIPSRSEWGLVASALLVLSAGSVLIGRSLRGQRAMVS